MSRLSEIKLEGNELQNYLETFNKDLEGNGQTITIIQTEGEPEPDEDEDGGTYFVDQSGNYYYQANKDSEPVLTEPPDAENVQYIVEEDENSVQEQEEQEEEEEDEEVVEPELEILPRTRKQNLALSKDETTEFEGVSIVQSENNDGEVSYVFIMDEKEEPEIDVNTNTITEEVATAEEDEDQKVYEFDEETPAPTSDVEVPKKKTTRNTKSQIATQMHMCNYCNYTSPKRYLLSRHMKSHSEERPYKCSVCERGFKTLASLQNHVNTHTGTKPHACKYCESCFTTSGELVRHVRYRHTHEKPHKCHECDYASVELSKLKRHIRCHTGERPYQCPHCTYASPDTFKLKRHLRIHTGEKPYECDVCQARFTQSNSLKAHKLIHSVGDKPVFHCELCPTTCGRKTDLRIHVQKLHTSDSPIKCKRCGNSFPDRYSYKIHTKTHEGEKCYKCEVCPYSSISARHLESHMLVHTDQKPYQCTTCEQAFRQKQLLKRHINLYHNPEYVPPAPREKTHVCPSCKRHFRHKGNLIRHMSIHDLDANTREYANALKEGRQKRIQIIDGQQVEIYSFDDGEDEGEEDESDEFEDEGDDPLDTNLLPSNPAKEENILAVDEDGQRYMVVEVINMEDEEESTQIIQKQDQDCMDVSEFILPNSMPDNVLSLSNNKKVRISKIADDKDMSTCFGFVDDDGNMDDDSCEIDKSTIQLIDYVE